MKMKSIQKRFTTGKLSTQILAQHGVENATICAIRPRSINIHSKQSDVFCHANIFVTDNFTASL